MSEAPDASEAFSVVDPDTEGAVDDTVAPDVDVVAVLAERDEYLETLQRLQAEFANYKKRVERDRAEVSERAAERLLESLLPVLDAFELALVNLPDGPEAGEVDAVKLRKGVELVFAEFLSVLERSGVVRMATDGGAFDPNEHEAVLQIDAETELEHPVVAETLRPGYRLHGRVLRPAMVKVAR